MLKTHHIYYTTWSLQNHLSTTANSYYVRDWLITTSHLSNQYSGSTKGHRGALVRALGLWS